MNIKSGRSLEEIMKKLKKMMKRRNVWRIENWRMLYSNSKKNIRISWNIPGKMLRNKSQSDFRNNSWKNISIFFAATLWGSSGKPPGTTSRRISWELPGVISEFLKKRLRESLENFPKRTQREYTDNFMKEPLHELQQKFQKVFKQKKNLNF